MNITDQRIFYTQTYTAALRWLNNRNVYPATAWPAYGVEECDRYAGAIADLLIARLEKLEQKYEKEQAT